MNHMGRKSLTCTEGVGVQKVRSVHLTIVMARKLSSGYSIQFVLSFCLIMNCCFDNAAFAMYSRKSIPLYFKKCDRHCFHTTVAGFVGKLKLCLKRVLKRMVSQFSTLDF